MKRKFIYITLCLLCCLLFLYYGSAEDITDYITNNFEENVEYTESITDILESIPEFSGQPYMVINNNIPNFTAEEKECVTAFEFYSELDALGRCGVAFANICMEIMPTEERGAIGSVKPSGWQLAKYDIVDGKYLYNRCHLIGYQLAGENANEKNLITGTRYLNVTGMLPFENKVYDYVKETGNHVLYRATPIYNGNDLVATGVQLEAYSVEDDGEGICFHVFLYNSQPGIEIDYATGESWILDVESAPSESGAQESTQESIQENAELQEYILNTNTKKFHRVDCTSVNAMKEKNKRQVSCTRDAVMEEGYVPCDRCNP